VDLRRRDGWWLWVGGPVPPGASAITFGRLVIVRRGRERDERLLRHELEHVAQYRRFGFVGFLLRYLRAYVGWRVRGYRHRGAYLRIPFEASAEWRARRSVSSDRDGRAPRDGAAAARSPAVGVAAASPPAASS